MSLSYLDLCIERIAALKEQESIIYEVSELVANATLHGKTIYFFGTGHSHAIAEEVYTRAGGMANLQAILIPELMLHQAPKKSTDIERLEGFAKVIMNLYPMNPGDVLFIISNSGRNAVPLELCELAREQGVMTVAITSLRHAKKVTPRYKDKALYELADYVLDNQTDPGDAIYPIEPLNLNMGPISTATGAILVNLIQIEAVKRLVEKGYQPDVFMSSNLDHADTKNDLYFKKYHIK